MTAERTQYQSDQEQQRAQDMSLQRTRPPTDVPGYEPRQFLGSGAYGEVWVAFDQNTGRHVAIKFYAHRGGLDWSLLSREVEKLVLLSADRYVVQLLDVGWDADPPYYVMEYIEQGSLDDRLRRDGPLRVPMAVEIFREVAVGLSHAHGKGVLHCDLKPANILLDQDDKPRLADFGQSRLSYEQSPALGTLFYMAPEQADLKAVPDARWDVYALGALLYCMVTGDPPYRSGDAASELESAADLADRLARYRKLIQTAPAPTRHRQVPGMDRTLGDILDRCLALDPEQRYPNVHTVLEALRARDKARVRRPLVMLGFVGPALLLAIMCLFAWRGYDRATGWSERHLTERVMRSNEFAARFVAEVVARELDQYMRTVEEIARSEQFISLLQSAVEDQDLNTLLQDLARAELPLVKGQEGQPGFTSHPTGPEAQQFGEMLRQFKRHPARQSLQQFVETLLKHKKTPKAASWFVTTDTGTFLASAFRGTAERSSLGLNYSWRTYFHGGPKDLEKWERPQTRITQTHLSAEFQSTATNTWKVAISTPVQRDDTTYGLIALTIELGNFVSFPGSESQFAVLADAREGRNQGVILEHPLYDQILSKTDALPSHFSRYRIDLNQWEDQTARLYRDPLGQDEQGAAFRRDWIAAKAPVQLAGESNRDAHLRDTGWVVLVQEDYQAAARPVHVLATKLVRDGLTALGVILAVIVALWYFVVRVMGEPEYLLQRRTVAPSSPTPLHSRDTVELPARSPRR